MRKSFLGGTDSKKMERADWRNWASIGGVDKTWAWPEHRKVQRGSFKVPHDLQGKIQGNNNVAVNFVVSFFHLFLSLP